jgi:hypothetical protein
MIYNIYHDKGPLHGTTISYTEFADKILVSKTGIPGFHHYQYQKTTIMVKSVSHYLFTYKGTQNSYIYDTRIEEMKELAKGKI